MRQSLFSLIALFLLTSSVYAGNKNRIGQAGAQELLLNPWASSSGMAGANTVSATGLESIWGNVSGLAFIDRTEVAFTYANLFGGAGVSSNAFGLAQRVGESSVIGAYVMSMGFGDIDITTIDQPEGGIGTFSPQVLNLNISYARAFSNSIYGGFTLRTISHAISNSRANGVAIDAGIRYVTGKDENLKFGIALKNVGPKMQHSGDGFSTKTTVDEKEFTLNQRTQAFELPSTLSLGVSYDYYLTPKKTEEDTSGIAEHRLTGSGTFISNSFGRDQFAVGVEYSFNRIIAIRAGFLYEEGIFAVETRGQAHTGPTFGGSVNLPLGKSGNTLSVDYSYRTSNPMAGTHAVGVRLNL